MMRNAILSLLAGALLLTFSACKKEYNQPVQLANIVVVHAAVNASTIVVNTLSQPKVWNNLYSGYTAKVNYGASVATAFTAGNSTAMSMAVWPDTLSPFYKVPDIQSQPGDVYTLFFAGTAGAIESIIKKEQLVRREDSATAVRFVNLISNSTPVTFRIRNAATPEITALAYKQISDFKVYDAHKANAGYVFEAIDTNNAVLASYTFSVARMYNVTLVLRGLIGGTGLNAPNFTKVNHY